MLSTWREVHMQHRFEDLALIADVLKQHQPKLCVELGTDEGGFAAFLGDTVKPWGGKVITFDHIDKGAQVSINRAGIENVECYIADVLHGSEVVQHLATPGMFLYCDNGHKETELALYAPLLPRKALLGVHDYVDEVDPVKVEPLLATLGYEQHRFPEFEALAHPEWYPRSLTRIWRRGW